MYGIVPITVQNVSRVPIQTSFFFIIISISILFLCTCYGFSSVGKKNEDKVLRFQDRHPDDRERNNYYWRKYAEKQSPRVVVKLALYQFVDLQKLDFKWWSMLDKIIIMMQFLKLLSHLGNIQWERILY